MIRVIQVTNVSRTAKRLTQAASQKDRRIVESILGDVQKNGDAAVHKYEKKFGRSSPASLRVSEKQISDAFESVSPKELKAVMQSKVRLEKTESAVKSILKNTTTTLDGIKISKRFLPIQSVGCYIPGGLARYPSSAVMSIVPAKVAGVKRIVAVSPPNQDGKIDALTVVAANISGATEIYKIGGAQAIGAMTFGTRTIPKVDKIVGPGGSFVTLAKSIASRHIAIDMLAGPTELGIIADRTANPRHVALDLISQSEHSGDARCYLITDSAKTAKAVVDQLAATAQKIARGDIVGQSLKQNGFVAICKSQNDMIELANRLAPEHLQVMTQNPQKVASRITAAGLVLVGGQSPSSASDYLLGSNHILPTDGFGRTRGSLSVLDFVKINTYVKGSKKALGRISKDLQVLTGAEGLPNHYEAVRGRLE